MPCSWAIRAATAALLSTGAVERVRDACGLGPFEYSSELGLPVGVMGNAATVVVRVSYVKEHPSLLESAPRGRESKPPCEKVLTGRSMAPHARG